MTVVFGKVRVLALGHVVFKADHICTFIEIDLSWCLFYSFSLKVITYVHNVVISFADLGHPHDSTHMEWEICKEQVKSFIIARRYIFIKGAIKRTKVQCTKSNNVQLAPDYFTAGVQFRSFSTEQVTLKSNKDTTVGILSSVFQNCIKIFWENL